MLVEFIEIHFLKTTLSLRSKDVPYFPWKYWCTAFPPLYLAFKMYLPQTGYFQIIIKKIKVCLCLDISSLITFQSYYQRIPLNQLLSLVSPMQPSCFCLSAMSTAWLSAAIREARPMRYPSSPLPSVHGTLCRSSLVPGMGVVLPKSIIQTLALPLWSCTKRSELPITWMGQTSVSGYRYIVM